MKLSTLSNNIASNRRALFVNDNGIIALNYCKAAEYTSLDLNNPIVGINFWFVCNLLINEAMIEVEADGSVVLSFILLLITVISILMNMMSLV